MATAALASGAVLYMGKTVLSDAIYAASSGIQKVLAKNPELSDLTERLDLYAELRVLDSIVRSLTDQDLQDQSPLAIALENVQLALDQVHDTVNQIHSRIEYHQTLWFPSWRSASYVNKLPKLEKDWRRLQHRKQVLLDTVQFVKAR